MTGMISDIEDYFAKGCGRCARFATPDCSTTQWADELSELRRICISAGLTETVKWGHPCYMHANRNIATLGAFRSDVRISFFNAALLKDLAGRLERPGPNTRHPCIIRFKDLACVRSAADLLREYLTEAMSYAEKGPLSPKDTSEVELPEELVEALDSDPTLAEAFFGLTPGRQKSYAINLRSAKKPETRFARIARFRSHILAGKGATER